MNYPKVILKSGKDQSVRRYHPWIFSGAIKKIIGNVNEGDLVVVTDNKDEFLALGHYQIGSIAIRIISFEEIEINEYDFELQVGQWTYLTLTCTDEQIKIYINGILSEMVNGDFATDGIKGKAYLGFSGYIGDDPRHDGDYCWQGQIDEVAIFNRGLTEKEVKQLFNMTGDAE